MASIDKEDVTLRNIVLGAGVSTTLVIWVSLADPVNIPKMLVLSLISGLLLGGLALKYSGKHRSKVSLGQLAVLIFGVGLLIAALTTDEHYTAFYGAMRRSNGAISYLALAIVGFVAMSCFDGAGISRLRDTLIWIGVFLAGYGFLQTTHSDPIKWNLLYNPIVGTLGNPDFVSALLGVCAVATLWWVFIERRNWVRATGIAIILFEIFIIRRSSSMQGLLVIGLGFSILVATKLWLWNKRSGQLALAAILLGSIPVVLGLLNKGPLAARLYKGSIQSRIDYWHASMSMFKAHPFLGVGLDRIGDNYWQYAPQIQVAASQGTDNAHNVFLQFLATGGLVLFLPYVFLVGVIAVTASRAVVVAGEKVRFEIMALFAIWISLILVSLISIDTLGVSVWFWISGGALYGFSRKILVVPTSISQSKRKIEKRAMGTSENARTYLTPLVSIFTVVVVLMIVVPAWRTSLAVQDLQRNRSGLDKSSYINKIVAISNWWPKNPQTLVALSDLAFRASDPKAAQVLAKEAISKDSRSYNANLLCALAYESQNNFVAAIPFREEMRKLNSWQINNLVQLTKNYVTVGNFANARLVAARLAEIDPTSAESVAAAKLVKG